jgi:hypothetical protein
MPSSKSSRSARLTPKHTSMPTETNTPAAAPSEPAMPEAPAPSRTPAQPRLRLDDTAIHTTYANYANVTSTREETVLLFGMIQAFNRANNEIPVKIVDRIVMTPFVARRLSRMLTNLIQNYEAQFGPLGEEGQ